MTGAALTCMVAVLLADAGVAKGEPQSSETRRPQLCWTPAQLVAAPGEQLVRRRTGSVRLDQVDTESGADDERPKALAPGKVIRRVELPEGDRRIALTFDLCEQAGETAGYDGRIVDVLRAADVKATFFAGGKWLLTHAERARQLMADPLFEIGQHGFEHRNVRLLQGKALQREILAPLQAYRQVRDELASRHCLDRTGKARAIDNSPERIGLIRFPYGSCNGNALQAVAQAGLTAIEWDFASGDPAPQSGPRSIIRNVLGRVRPGAIIVFHANGRGWHTGEALPALIDALKRQGYSFATVGELIATPGARLVTADSCFDQRPGDLDRYDRHTVAAKRGKRGQGTAQKTPQRGWNYP